MQDINILVNQQVSLSQTVNSFKASGFPFSKRIYPLFLHTPLIRLYKEVHEGNRIRGAFFLLNVIILRQLQRKRKNSFEQIKIDL